MGCDIHMIVETRDKSTNKWSAIIIKNPYLAYTDDDGEKEQMLLEPYNGRDYELFGIFAHVRSDTYDSIDDFNRGIPCDASEETQERWEKDSDWCHSATWYGLDELINWGSHKRNFHSVDYSDPFNAAYLDDIKKEDKSVRKRFCCFVEQIMWFVNMTHLYVPTSDVRVIMWFDS